MSPISNPDFEAMECDIRKTLHDLLTLECLNKGELPILRYQESLYEIDRIVKHFTGKPIWTDDDLRRVSAQRESMP